MPEPAPPTSRLQRTLLFTLLALVALSAACWAALIIGYALGVGRGAGFSKGLWPLVFVFPLPALSVALLLVVALFVVTLRQRSSAARTDRRARAGTVGASSRPAPPSPAARTPHPAAPRARKGRRR